MAELEIRISPSARPPMVTELLFELLELGYEASVLPGYEQRSRFQPLEIVIWLTDNVGDEAIGAIVAVMVGWIRRKIRRRPERPPTIRVLLKPNGEVLREVEVDIQRTMTGEAANRHRLSLA